MFTNDLFLFSATSQRTVSHEVLKDFSRSAHNVQLWLTCRLLWFLHLWLISHIHKVTQGREWHKMTQMFTPAERDFKWVIGKRKKNTCYLFSLLIWTVNKWISRYQKCLERMRSVSLCCDPTIKFAKIFFFIRVIHMTQLKHNSIIF